MNLNEWWKKNCLIDGKKTTNEKKNITYHSQFVYWAITNKNWERTSWNAWEHLSDVISSVVQEYLQLFYRSRRHRRLTQFRLKGMYLHIMWIKYAKERFSKSRSTSHLSNKRKLRDKIEYVAVIHPLNWYANFNVCQNANGKYTIISLLFTRGFLINW